jgi:hypothetical protein
MRIPPAFATVVTLALVAVSAAACSSGSKTASGGSSSGQAKPESALTAVPDDGSSSAGTSTGNTKAFDVCAALPATAASQITGTTFTAVKSGDTQGIIFSCDYTGTAGALLQISVTTKGGKIGYDSDVEALKTISHAPDSVSGVGDEAFSTPDPKGNAGSVGASAFASYGALFGDTYVKIGGLTYVTPAQGKQIAEELHSKV